MFAPKRYKYLADNEIAGAETINPIIDFVRGIRSTDDFIELNPNGIDSMDIDVNRGAILEWLKTAYPHTSINHTFKATINDTNKISCTSGKVYFPSNSVSISALGNTTCVSGNMVYIRLNSKTSGSLEYGSISHTIQPASGSNPNRVCLPICTTYRSNNVWYVQYYHIGDYAFTQYPYFWVDGYDRTKPQALMHYEDEDFYRWVDYGDCSDSQ